MLFFFFQINVTADMIQPPNEKFLLYLKLKITDFFPTAKLVFYVREGSFPGIQPTQFAFRYPIGAPQIGGYTASPFYLDPGLWYVGLFGSDMALFETTADFYFKAGYNTAVLNSASQIPLHLSFLLSLLIAISLL